MPTMKQITEDARKFVAMKKASYNKEAIAGQSPDSYPGAEHDKPIPDGAKSPNPEVKQDLPPGGRSASGAEKSEKLEMGHSTDATQPSGESVCKEPLISSDAKAEPKSGSAKMANDLMASVKRLQDSLVPKPVVKKAEEDKNIGKDKDNKDKSEKTSVAGAPEPDKKPAIAKDEKSAGNSQLELTQDVLAKIASCILSTEEGWAYAEKSLTKAAGAEAARETIGLLQQQAEDYEKQAAYQQGQADADQAMHKQAAEAQYGAGYQDADAMINMVLQKEAQLKSMGYTDQQLVKLGQAIADESMEGMDNGPDAGGMPGMEQVPGADEAMGEMAGPGEGGGDVTPEELAQALAELVQEGQIQPEDAQAVMQYIQSAEQGGGEMGGMPPEGEMPPEAGMEEGGPPPEAEPTAEEKPAEEKTDKGSKSEKKESDKEAAAKVAEFKGQLLASIKKAKAAR